MTTFAHHFSAPYPVGYPCTDRYQKLDKAFFPLDVFSDSFILFAYRSSDTAISNAWHKYEGQKLRIRKTPAYFCKGIVRFISC